MNSERHVTSALYKMGAVLAMVWVTAITIQAMLIELARWVRVLAPWLLLTVLLGVVCMLLAAVIRRRRYGY